MDNTADTTQRPAVPFGGHNMDDVPDKRVRLLMRKVRVHLSSWEIVFYP